MHSRLFAIIIFCLVFPTQVFSELSVPQQVSPHAWAWIGPYGAPSKENMGFRMNLGFVVGNKAVAIIDSGYSDAMAKEMLQTIAQHTDVRNWYVINTNSQPHRILGNGFLQRHGANIISAEDAMPRITSEGSTMAGNAESLLGLAAKSITPPPSPDQLITETTSIDLGGVTLRIHPVGHAHTAGSLIVEVVEDKVIFTGDVLYGGRLLALLPISRLDGWLEAYAYLEPFSTATLVPGHGLPGTLETFHHPTRDYLQTLKQHMDEAVENGEDMQGAIKSLDQSAWSELADFESLSGRNAHQAYTERELASFE